MCKGINIKQKYKKVYNEKQISEKNLPSYITSKYNYL